MPRFIGLQLWKSGAWGHMSVIFSHELATTESWLYPHWKYLGLKEKTEGMVQLSCHRWKIKLSHCTKSKAYKVKGVYLRASSRRRTKSRVSICKRQVEGVQSQGCLWASSRRRTKSRVSICKRQVKGVQSQGCLSASVKSKVYKVKGVYLRALSRSCTKSRFSVGVKSKAYRVKGVYLRVSIEAVWEGTYWLVVTACSLLTV